MARPVATRSAGSRSTTARVAQAWVELRSDDPEAVSALTIARTRLPAGRRLASLRRMRLFELAGRLPAAAALTDLLHRSTQFYNPHKERCTVRTSGGAVAGIGPAAWVALVADREGERRRAAERWWHHETGESVEVREAVAWVMEFEGRAERGDVESLTVVTDRRHGLLCNPHAQRWALSEADVPLPWIMVEPRGDAAGASPRGKT
jgi:hypothetical protein